MSYALAAALQTAVFDQLSQDAALTLLVGANVFDALPSGAAPNMYVHLGSETVRDASDKTDNGAVHLFTISVVSDAPGFATAKTAAAAICDALVDADLPLSRGRLVSLSFDRARAVRARSANSRQIDLRFRARVEDS